MTIDELRTGVRIARSTLKIVGLSIALTGCVTLTAPEKPIEINLTINIRQEVLVKLEREVQDMISKNPGVF